MTCRVYGDPFRFSTKAYYANTDLSKGINVEEILKDAKEHFKKNPNLMRFHFMIREHSGFVTRKD